MSTEYSQLSAVLFQKRDRKDLTVCRTGAVIYRFRENASSVPESMKADYRCSHMRICLSSGNAVKLAKRNKEELQKK